MAEKKVSSTKNEVIENTKTPQCEFNTGFVNFKGKFNFGTHQNINLFW